MRRWRGYRVIRRVIPWGGRDRLGRESVTVSCVVSRVKYPDTHSVPPINQRLPACATLLSSRQQVLSACREKGKSTQSLFKRLVGGRLSSGSEYARTKTARGAREGERTSTSPLLRRPRHGVVVLFSGPAGSMQLSWSSGKPPLFYSTAIREARQGRPRRSESRISRREIRDPLANFSQTRSFPDFACW